MQAFLAEHRGELFPDEMFADLFPSGRGRPSVPADVVATGVRAQGAALTEVFMPGRPPATGPNAAPIAFWVVALFPLGLLALRIERAVWARQHAVA